eukprot:806650-Pleurochrysis_carterae.AAC.1
MCSSVCALSIAFAVMAPLACSFYPCVSFSLRWARSMPQERNARSVPSHRLAFSTPLSCARDDSIR